MEKIKPAIAIPTFGKLVGSRFLTKDSIQFHCYSSLGEEVKN